jgi:hypothetical protein
VISWIGEIQIFTADFLFMINVLKPLLLKQELEDIWSVLHYKLFLLIFCYTVLHPGFQSVGSP